jgi:large subunit ribosomal protein L23
MDLYQVLRRPVTTEKTTILSNTLRQYTFEVDYRANKHQIKEAVEQIFDVDVEKVRVMVVPSQPRRWGRVQGHKPAWKKAVVTLAEGDSISFFEGV